jgi:adenylate cyclase
MRCPKPSRAGGKSLKQGRKRSAPKRRNAPKARPNRGASIAGQETVVARLTRELSEERKRRTATSEVLQLLSRSHGDLNRLFDTILSNATKLCQAHFGTLFLCEADAFRIVAQHNAPPAYAEFRRREPLVRAQPLLRMAETKQLVHIADVREYVASNPADKDAATFAKLSGVRTVFIVPMLKDGEVVGAIVIYRREVRAFSDREIELLKNFAAQAVIAIENTRLLNELRQRTADLTESLEQQTATADVLRIISSSPGELTPVFQAMLENATRICDAKFGSLWLATDGGFRLAATHGLPATVLRHQIPVGVVIHPGPTLALARAASGRETVHIADLRTDVAYLDGEPVARAGVELGQIRTLLMVPMLREREVAGAFAIFRQEVRPFTDRQIALVTNFAAQAVIAIENTRLLNELRERTEEVVKLNQQLERRVADQVGEIERMGRLRRFLPQQVADLIVASGTEKQLESHRREITALFCDLRGFTGFSESSDPEDVMALLRDYHAAIGEIIIKYSGTLERFAGDGVMVIFNDPVPVENPALQAVLMALDMRAAIGGMIETWRDLGHDLGFGIGIAHGFATLGTIGFEGRFDYAAIGTVSNVASRLCDEASPGQILISPRVRQAVEKAVAVEPVGEFTLKGIRRPMAAYNVLESSPSKSN